MNRVHAWITHLLTLALLGGIVGVAHAQAYPTKPVQIVVGFGAGGVADTTIRLVAQKLSERLGRQFIVDNRAGAGGIVAATTVAKAQPDGHTLLLISNGNAVSVSLFKSLPYDPVRAFAPVSTLGFFDLLIATSAESKIASVKDLIAFAKANPNQLNVGTISIGSTQNLAAELFKSMAGVDFTVVPYKDSGSLVLALRSNQVQVAFEILSPMLPHIKGDGGPIRPLAVTSEHRFGGLKNLPTVAESGLADYKVASWNGLVAPAGTPKPIIDRLNSEINAILALPEVKQSLLELGVVARGSTPEALRDLLVSEIARWKVVVEKAGIEKQ